MERSHAIGITAAIAMRRLRPGLLALSQSMRGLTDPSRFARVRYQIKYGADVIKTCATGGVLSEGDAAGATQYSFEELKALVDEAK